MFNTGVCSSLFIGLAVADFNAIDHLPTWTPTSLSLHPVLNGMITFEDVIIKFSFFQLQCRLVVAGLVTLFLIGLVYYYFPCSYFYSFYCHECSDRIGSNQEYLRSTFRSEPSFIQFACPHITGLHSCQIPYCILNSIMFDWEH